MYPLKPMGQEKARNKYIFSSNKLDAIHIPKLTNPKRQAPLQKSSDSRLEIASPIVQNAGSGTKKSMSTRGPTLQIQNMANGLVTSTVAGKCCSTSKEENGRDVSMSRARFICAGSSLRRCNLSNLETADLY
jgi:hypothetical protein